MRKINRMKIVQFSTEYHASTFAWYSHEKFFFLLILQNFHVKRKSHENHASYFSLLYTCIIIVNTDVEKVPYILITMCEIDEGAFNEKRHKYLYIGMSRFMVSRRFLFIPSMCRQWTKFLRTLPFQAPHLSSSMSPIFRTLGNPVSSWVLTLTTPFYS